MKRMDTITAYLCLTLSMLIAGSAVVVSKVLTSALPVFLSTEGGLLIALLFLLPYTFLVKKERISIPLKSHAVLFCQGILGILFYRIFLLIGLKFTTSATGGLIASVSPAVVSILAFFFLKERLTVPQILGVFFVVFGLFLVNESNARETIQNGNHVLLGNLFVLGAVLCEAVFFILSKVGDKKITPLYRTTMVTAYAFLSLFPFAIYESLQFDFTNTKPSVYLCILYYGTFVSVLSYVLWFQGVLKISANQASVFNGIVPISSVFLSALLLKENITILQVAGLITILTGIGISCFRCVGGNQKLEDEIT